MKFYVAINFSQFLKQSAFINNLFFFIPLLAADIPQLTQSVLLPRDSSAQITVNLTVYDDTLLECNETFTLILESSSGENILTIDPVGNQSIATIIDDDGLFPRFFIIMCFNIVFQQA